MVVVGTADGALLFYEELLGRPGRPWELLNSLQAGRQAINAIAFAPRELGALVAAASGDGWCRCGGQGMIVRQDRASGFSWGRAGQGRAGIAGHGSTTGQSLGRRLG